MASTDVTPLLIQLKGQCVVSFNVFEHKKKKKKESVRDFSLWFPSQNYIVFFGKYQKQEIPSCLSLLFINVHWLLSEWTASTRRSIFLNNLFSTHRFIMLHIRHRVRLTRWWHVRLIDASPLLSPSFHNLFSLSGPGVPTAEPLRLFLLRVGWLVGVGWGGLVVVVVAR